MAVFLSELGLRSSEIGWVLGFAPIIRILTVPLFSGWADRTSSPKDVFRMLVPLNGASFCLFGIVLFMVKLHGANLFVFCFCVYALHSVFRGSLSTLLDALTLQSLGDDEEAKMQYGQERLWGAVSWAICNLALGATMDHTGMSAMIVLMAVSSAGLYALASVAHVGSNPVKSPCVVSSSGEGIEMELKRPGDKSSHGRVYSGVPSDAGDTKVNGEDWSEIDSVDKVDGKRHESGVGIDDSLAVEEELGGLTGGVGSGGDVDDDVASSSVKGPRVQADMYSVAGIVTQSAETAAFFLNAMTLWMGMALVESFLFLFLTEELGSSLLTCGVSVVITVIFEIPLFAMGKSLLGYCGVMPLVLLAQTAYVVRAVGYTLVPNAWWVLALEPMHGVTYACYRIAAVHYLARIAPPGLETSAQGLASTFGALGSILGQLIGGWVFENYGSVVMYRGVAFIVLVSMGVLLATLTFCPMAARETQMLDGASVTSQRLTGPDAEEDVKISEIAILDQVTVHTKRKKKKKKKKKKRPDAKRTAASQLETTS